MENQPSGELSGALVECAKKLSGDLNLAGVYHHLDSGLGYTSHEVIEYFQERAERISAGEDVWMARDMASPVERTFDFFSGGEVVGSLRMDFTTDGLSTESTRHEDTMYEGRNLIEAIDSIEGQLTRASL